VRRLLRFLDDAREPLAWLVLAALLGVGIGLGIALWLRLL
jgi:hypothetical protein